MSDKKFCPTCHGPLLKFDRNADPHSLEECVRWIGGLLNSIISDEGAERLAEKISDRLKAKAEE